MTSFMVSIFMYLVCCCIAQGYMTLPAVLPPVTVDGDSESCPPAEVMNQVRNSTKEAILTILQNSQSCSCDSPGHWRRIAHLDMSDPNQQCPTNLRLVTTPVRGCGRSSTSMYTCDSAVFTANNRAYSRVCGRVRGRQIGSTDAFLNYNEHNQRTLESVYLDGISLTHGAAGSRQHIWSFVAAIYDNGLATLHTCPCNNPNGNWPHRVPPFVGNNYFCDSGNPGPSYSNGADYTDDPLWDGEGCGSATTCCQFNTPPRFCATLPQSTTDDIELRLCFREDNSNEDILIDLIDIYVM